MKHPLGYVVHVKTPGTSGGETRSYQVAQALAAAGSSVHLYGRVNSSFRWASGVHPHQLKQPTPIGAAQLARDFGRHHIRVAIERYQFPLFNAGFFAQQARRQPTVFEVHGFPIDELFLLVHNHTAAADPLARLIVRVPRPLWARLQAATLRRAAHLIVTSGGTRDILTSLDVPSERISVIYNGVDPALFDPAARDSGACRARLGLPADGEIVLYAGSLFHEELATIIQAAPAVLAARPSTCFVYAGTGPARALRDLARACGLSETQFQTIPPLSHQHMPDLLAAADVVLAAYRLDSERFRQGFYYSPLKVMEALAMAKAVVTIDVAELRTVFDGVPNVQFVESGCPSSWAVGVLRALDGSRAPALSQGRDFVVSGHRWQDAAEKYLTIIRSLERETT